MREVLELSALLERMPPQASGGEWLCSLEALAAGDDKRVTGLAFRSINRERKIADL